MNKKKMALVHSVIALLLCCSMLIGTTFAWFTDSVTSGKNRIIAGNLDVELAYMDANGDWQTVNANTNVFEENTLWEPGHTEVVYLRVSNAGTLALTYQLGVNIAAETGSINVAGEEFVLSDYIEFAAIEGVETAFASRDAARAAVQSAQILSTGYTQEGQLMAGDPADYVAFVVYMPETVGNEANYRTGEQAPKIELGINLYATQEVNEQDSFNKNYDANAKAEFFDGFQGGYAVAVVTADDQGVTTEEVAVSGGDVSAVIPAGVQVAEGNSSLGLSVTLKDDSEANIQLGESEEKRALDVHIEGVAQGNTVPMLITLKHYLSTGINTGALRLYHVENGATVAMTQVAVPANHNEFSYDPATGDVTLAMASFSEIAIAVDENNPWDGETRNYLWYNTSDKELTIYNADQLAGFADIVDGKAKNIAQDSFDGKTVNLGNNIYLDGKLFDPIGWGYEHKDWNAGGVEGKPFKGTFDGNNKTIFDLYQQGWDLESATGTDYTYTNCGFGLFAAAADATFKNLTIYGADIKAECVEMGVLVGLSQGNCTYTNINIQNSKVANYQRPTGGLIGEVSCNGTTTITNVNIDDDVVVGSLWGDFDAPVGGVVGARWANGTDNQINMTDVSVECRLDVYNDVTSSYQWYAYRRAGMLIGNTETSAKNENGTNIATAEFLHCSNVTVEYGGWVDYHYCEFNNHEPRWPFVRVEAGENCSAFSNPRWGVPNDINGKKVVDMNHKHADGDDCYVHIPFGQLYGGGQGIYGQFEHENVTIVNYKYKVEYINKGEVLWTYYAPLTNNEEYKLPVDEGDEPVHKAIQSMSNEGVTNIKFSHWMNAGSTIVESIPADNIANYKVYPSFENLFTATFVDQQGNIIGYEFFTKNTANKVTTKANNTTPPAVKDCVFDHWEVHVTNDKGETTVKKALTDYLKDSTLGTTDITLYPIYTYNGDVNLIPVDTDGDGTTNYYQVGGYSNNKGKDLVVIPGVVNGIEVTTINEGAFASYPDLHSVVIPKTITTAGKSFLAKPWSGLTNNGEEVTIYYEGSYEEWMLAESEFNSNWENGIGNNTRIFFLNGTGKVDHSGIYLEATVKGSFISGRYVDWAKKTVNNDIVEKYDTECTCKSCNGDMRPDVEYWN